VTSKGTALGARIHRISRLVCAAGLAVAVSAPALAGPEGAKVVHGQATVESSGSLTTITAGNNAILHYDSFNIGVNEAVRFVQPGASSRVLNRIVGDDPSTIAGSLTANGRVYIVNPAGVYFTESAVVNVGALYAAAGKIGDADFLNSVDRFTDMTGSVVNEGHLRGSEAVHLLGKHVANRGRIVAEGGLVTMSAGDEVIVGPARGHMFARIKGSAEEHGEAGVENAGEVSAARVSFGAGDLYGVALRDTSKVKARQVAIRGGDRSDVNVSGVIDASGPVGGDVSITGGEVALRGASVDASGTSGGGTVLIGGGFQGRGRLDRSETTEMDGSSRVNADATAHGDGGTIVLWSDGTTRFAGSLSAKGGASGGDGGLIETSGKVHLFSRGSVDASAKNGKGGLWLLDPLNVTIDAVTSNVNQIGGVFSPTGGVGPTVGVGDIQTVLEGGTDVTITTSGPGAQDGDITWLAGNDLTVDLAANGARTFLLDANGTIDIRSNITATGNALSLDLQAGTGTLPDVVGSVLLADNIAFDLNGGSFLASGAGSFTANQTHTIDALDVTLTFGQGVDFENQVSTRLLASSSGTGSFDLTAPSIELAGDIGSSGLSLTGPITLDAPVALTTGGGDATLGAVDGGEDLTITAGAGNVTLGNVGDGTRVGDLTIASAADVTTGTVTANTLLQSAGTGTSSFGTIDTTAAIGITTNAIQLQQVAAGGGVSLSSIGAMALNGAVTSGGLVSLTNSGQLTTAGTITGGSVQQIGGGTILLGGDVTTSGGAISLQSPITLTSSVLLSTGVGAADITLSGAVNATNVDVEDLTLEAGTGSIQTQALGASTRLGDLRIENANNVTASGTISASSLVQVSGMGLSEYGAINTIGAGGVSLDGASFLLAGVTTSTGGLDVDATGTIGLTGPVTTAAGVTLTNGSLLTIGSGNTITASTFVQDGAGSTSLGANIAAGGGISFASPVTLTGDVQLNTSAGGGALTMGAVNGTTASVDDLTLGAGVGSITLGNVGAGTRLGVLNILSAGAGATTQAITASRLTQASGSGAFGAVNATQGIQLDGVSFSLGTVSSGAAVDIDAGGAVTLAGGTASGPAVITNGGLLTTNGGFSASSFTQDGAGATNLGGNISSPNGISFAGPLTLTGPAELNAGLSTVTLGGVSAGASSLTLTGDEIDLTGGAGSVSGTGALVLQPSSASSSIDIAASTGALLDLSAADLAALADGFSSITIGRAGGAHAMSVGNASFADSLLLRAPSGTINVLNSLTTTGPSALSLEAGQVVLGGSIDSSADLTITGSLRIGEGSAGVLTSANDVTINGGVTGTVGGATESLSIDAASAVEVAGNITSGGAQGLSDVTIVNAGSGSVAGVSIAGSLTTTNPVAGGLLFGGPLSAGSVSISAGSVTFNDDVATQGLLDVTSPGLISLASGASGGQVSIAGDLELAGDLMASSGNLSIGGLLTLSSNASIAATNGDVSLSNASLGAFDLTVIGSEIDLTGGAGSVAGTGQIAFEPPTAAGSIGVAGGAGLLDISAADLAALQPGFSSVAFGRTDGQHQITIAPATFANSVVFRSPGGSITTQGAVGSSGASSLNFGGPTVLGGNVSTGGGAISFGGATTLGGNITLTTLGGDVAFAATVNADAQANARTLTVMPGAGDVQAGAAIGGAQALASLSIDGTGSIALQDVNTTGVLSLSTTDLFAEGDLNAGGPLTVNGDLTVGSNIALNSGGSLTLDGLVDGDIDGRQLTLDSTGTIAINAAIGSDTPLASLTAGGSSIAVNASVNVSSALIVQAPTIALGGDLSAGSLTLDGTVSLASDVDLQSTGDLMITGAVNGPQSLSLTSAGNADLNGAVGAVTALTSFNAAASQLTLQNVFATGALSTNAASTTLAGSTLSGGSIAIGGDYSTLGSLSFMSSGGDIALAGDGSLGGNLTLMSLGGDIALGPIAGGGSSIDLRSGAGAVTLASGSGLGAINILADNVNLTGPVAGATFMVAPSTTSRPIRLGGASAAGVLHLSSAEIDRLSDGFTSVLFGRSAQTAQIQVLGGTFRDPARFVTQGAVRVAGPIAGAGDASFDFAGSSTLLSGSLSSASGRIRFGSPVTLFAGSTVTGTGPVVFTGAIDGAFPLAASGATISAGGAIGAGTPLTSLSLTGATSVGGVVSAGSVFLDGPITLTADTSLLSGPGGIVVQGPINGAFSLLGDAGAGSLAFSAPVGASTALTSVDLTASSLTLGGVNTTGDQMFTGASTLSGIFSTTAGSITAGGDVTLGGDASMASATGAVSIAGAVDGPFALSLAAPMGNVTANGGIGQNTLLGSLTVDSDAASIGDVSTSGDQLYGGDVTLMSSLSAGGSITLTDRLLLASDADITGSSASSVISLGMVDGPFALSLTAPTVGSLGAIGASTPLASLTADGTAMSFGEVSTSGTQQYTGPITLSGDLAARGGVLIDGPLSVTGAASITDATDSVTVRGDIDGPGSLRLTAGADVMVDGDVGSSSMLSEFSIGDANNTTLQSVRAGTVRQEAGAGVTTFTGDLVAGAGGIDLNGTAFRFGGLLVTTGSGDFRLGNTGPIEFGPGFDSSGLSGSLLQTGSGMVTVSADLSVPTGMLALGGPVTLVGDRTLSAQDIALTGGVNSDGAPASLTLQSAGTTTLAGTFGTSGALTRIETDAPGTTRLSADINTTSGILIGDNAVVFGETFLRSPESIRFGSTLDGDGSGLANLTIVTDTTAIGDVGETIPEIRFSGNVGETTPLDMLRLNFDPSAGVSGHDSVPVLPTIVRDPSDGDGDLTFNVAGDFIMGQNEKLAAAGDISITAGGRAIIGDISALGDVSVIAPLILIQTRDAGFVLTPFGFLDDDIGVDFVTGGQFFFSTTPGVLGEAASPGFASPTGSDDAAGTLDDFSQRVFGEVSPSAIRMDEQLFDLRSLGPSNTNVAEALAGAAPRLTQSGSVAEEITVGSAQREELQQLGVYARDVPQDELTQFLVGRALYQDLGAFTDAGSHVVTVNRLSSEQVERVLSNYRRLLFTSARDPETGEAIMVDRRPEIRRTLAAVAAEYRELDEVQGIDGAGLAKFIADRGGDAADDLEAIRTLLRELGLLGLSDVELSGARTILIGYVRPRLIPRDAMDDLLASAGSVTERESAGENAVSGESE